LAIIDLNECVNYVAGIVNAADWKTVNDVALNSTSTITSASAAFTQNDVGKAVSIAGGRAGNLPLLAYIASVTNATTAVLSVAAGVTRTLASMMYGGRSEDPRHSLQRITKAVLQKDIEISHAILLSGDHPRRNHFSFTTAVIAQTNTGVPVTSHAGQLRMVEIQHTDTTYRVARELPVSALPKLLSWLENRASVFGTGSEGYYVQTDGQIYFVGSNLRLTYFDLVINDTACQAPSEYIEVVALLAAADLFSTEGDDLQASQLLSSLGATTATTFIANERPAS